jgi:hypothetical protein
MCSNNFKNNIFEYHSTLSNTTLNICEKCANREYYGTGSNSKKWKKDKRLGLSYGKANNIGN